MLGSRGWTIPLRAYRYIYQQATCDGGQWYAHKGSKPMRRGVLRRRQSLEDIRTAVDGNGGRDPLYLLESGTRLLHLLPRDGLTRVYSLAKFDAKDLVFGASPNALFEAVAPEAPRGYFPRGFSGEPIGRSLASTAVSRKACCQKTGRSRRERRGSPSSHSW
jgi:hypothetical protein